MHALLQPIRDYVADTMRGLVRGWNDFWFRPVDPATLGMVRICAGLVLLYIHVTCAPWILDFVGPNAWVDEQAIAKLRDVDALAKHAVVPDLSDAARRAETWYGWSIWFWIQDPQAIVVVHSVFLLAVGCFVVGFFSRLASIAVWVGHVSYVHRSHNIWFGMDTILLLILLYMMFAPCGATLSIDRLLQRMRAARRGFADGGMPVETPPQPSWSANLGIRLIQVHMAIVYLWSGLSKLQGNEWWNGVAGYRTMMVPEFRIFSLDAVVRDAPDVVILMVSSLVTYFTLVFEITFIFLIWNRRLRPLLLFTALMLHLGIGVFMGLGGFACIMLTGCLAFVSPESMRRFLSIMFKGEGGLRFVIDRKQEATLEAASLVQAADPFGQVKLVEVHDSSVAAPAGSVILQGGEVMKGSSACGKLVRSLRVLWLAWPLAVWRFRGLGREESAAVAARRS